LCHPLHRFHLHESELLLKTDNFARHLLAALD
jgi:hypothetical protein